MSEPTRAIVVDSDLPIRQGEYVWVHERTANAVKVEHRGKFLTLPAKGVRPAPVPRPLLRELHALDPCFSSPESLQLIVQDDSRLFRLLRCPHGRLFLDDTRGGIAMYSRLILVEPAREGDEPRALWNHYHAIPEDLLNHWGVAL